MSSFESGEAHCGDGEGCAVEACNDGSRASRASRLIQSSLLRFEIVDLARNPASWPRLRLQLLKGFNNMAAFDSALVRKLTRYLPLGREELAVLGQLEAQRRFVAAGTEPGPRAAGRAPRLHPRGGLGLLLQAAARRRAAGDRLPDPRRRHRPAQRPVAHLRPQLRRGHRRHRGRGVGAAAGGGVRAAAPAGRGVPVGSLARRGDGGRASGEYRPAQRPGPHRAFPGRARAAPAARRPGFGHRLRLSLEPVPAGRCRRAHGDPRQPHPAPAARAQAAHLPRRRGDIPRPRRACASSPGTTAAISTRTMARTDAWTDPPTFF